MSAPTHINELVNRYQTNREDYRSGGYKELRLRKEFVDPFFEALSWDMSNRQNYAEAYKDVVHEDSLRIATTVKAPDYAFRIGGTRKFFVETKTPSIDIKNDIASAYQLRTYGWSAKLSLSILTNFEEFAVYDCRVEPKAGDRASTARITYYRFEDYASVWDEISAVFGRDSILQGAFDRYALKVLDKKGTAEFDVAFLADIERWRSTLAKNIAYRNVGLNVKQLNIAVQRTIDRIVFLRIAEDRGFETYGSLQKLIKGADLYKRLCSLFRHADSRYNSGLFHFKREETSVEAADSFTLKLAIDDDILREIFKRLYYPDSPYQFSVVSADILGQVYEQFLGKVIRLTGRTAVVEAKPEVKKAGGVYYTPTYIVKHIVETVLSKLLEGKSTIQASGEDKRIRGAAPIRIVDPACGSGSFLIEVYQYLLDWYLGQYLADGAEKYSTGRLPKLYRTATGDWRLSIAEKRRVLLAHVYGVDIDEQAVEVTKLSLLMKVLEGEAGDALANQMTLFYLRVLPDLGANIKCGNSLIDPKLFTESQAAAFKPDVYETINAFDWEQEFDFIKVGHGFDGVVGNPPYLSIDSVWGKGDPRLTAIKSQYPDIYNDKTDLYYYFLAQALRLSRRYVSFICSRAFLEAYKGDKLRKHLSEGSSVRSIIDFRNYAVFRGVGITTAIITIEKVKGRKGDVINTYKYIDSTGPVAAPLQPNGAQFASVTVPLMRLAGGQPWTFDAPIRQDFFDALDAAGQSLGSFMNLGQGMQTGDNKVFSRRTRADVKLLNLPKGLYRKRATNTDIRRYHVDDREEILLFLENEQSFDALPPALKKYLASNREALSSRAACIRGNCQWWKFTWPLHKELYQKPRILCPYLATSNRFALVVSDEFIGLTDTTVIFESNQAEDLRYILAVLNSKLIQYRYKASAKLKSAGIYEYFWNSISKIPIKRINFNSVTEKAAHDRLVELTLDLEASAAKMAGSKIASELKAATQHFSASDQEAEAILARLYGVSTEQLNAIA